MNRYYVLALLTFSGLVLAVFSVIRDEQVTMPDKAPGTERSARHFPVRSLVQELRKLLEAISLSARP
jgi:hypothetical protein